MPATVCAGKSLEELRHWQRTDPHGLIEYILKLQEEVRQLRDVAAQNSRNSSLPPSADRSSEKPKPKSLLTDFRSLILGSHLDIRQMVLDIFDVRGQFSVFCQTPVEPTDSRTRGGVIQSADPFS